VFYYFKQRLSVIEQSQMEQARVMQAIITRGIHAQAHVQSQSHMQAQVQSDTDHALKCQREITITQNGLIEVSSDSESESESESESDSDTESGSESDKWSIGDEIHQPDSYHEEFNKNMLINAICIDSGYVIESITIANDANDAIECIDDSNKKIISLNKSALGNDVDANADDVDDDSDSSSSDDQDQEQMHANVQDFELKIGYKSTQNKDSSAKAMHLNYGNMSVPALRQLAKERGLGGDDGELQKLKKKDLVALLQ
jgi:hypothetical protein